VEHMRGRVNGETAKQHEDEKVKDSETEIREERHSEKFQRDSLSRAINCCGVFQ
jgi:hypothetical protein